MDAYFYPSAFAEVVTSKRGYIHDLQAEPTIASNLLPVSVVMASTRTGHSTDANKTSARDSAMSYPSVPIHAGIFGAMFGIEGAQEHLKHIVKSEQAPILVCPEDQHGCHYLCVALTSASNESSERSTRRGLKRVDVLHEPAFGRVVEQHLYRPIRSSSFKANAINAPLQRPTWFRHANGGLEVPLQLVLDQSLRNNPSSFLDNPHRPAKYGGGTTKFMVVHVQGKELYERQVQFGRAPTTRIDLLRRIVLVLRRLFEDNVEGRYCSSVPLNKIVILGCAQVSKGRLQPIFSVCDTVGY